jgi:hypothetical protein
MEKVGVACYTTIRCQPRGYVPAKYRGFEDQGLTENGVLGEPWPLLLLAKFK